MFAALGNIVTTTLIVLGAHTGTVDGLNKAAGLNYNSTEIVYTQAPYVESVTPQTNPDAAKFTDSRTTEVASTKADEEVGP